MRHVSRLNCHRCDIFFTLSLLPPLVTLPHSYHGPSLVTRLTMRWTIITLHLRIPGRDKCITATSSASTIS